jgi:hypothetical protein
MSDRPKWIHTEPTEPDFPLLTAEGDWVSHSMSWTAATLARIGWQPIPVEHTPPPAPVERYTVQPANDLDAEVYGNKWRIADALEGAIALCALQSEAERIAAALNLLDRLTPEPI